MEVDVFAIHDIGIAIVHCAEATVARLHLGPLSCCATVPAQRIIVLRPSQNDAAVGTRAAGIELCDAQVVCKIDPRCCGSLRVDLRRSLQTTIIRHIQFVVGNRSLAIIRGRGDEVLVCVGRKSGVIELPIANL